MTFALLLLGASGCVQWDPQDFVRNQAQEAEAMRNAVRDSPESEPSKRAQRLEAALKNVPQVARVVVGVAWFPARDSRGVRQDVLHYAVALDLREQWDEAMVLAVVSDALVRDGLGIKFWVAKSPDGRSWGIELWPERSALLSAIGTCGKPNG